MAGAAVAADVFKALDVALYLALKVALELETLELAADGVLLVGGKLVGALVVVDLSLSADSLGARYADAIQSGERVRSVLVGESYT